MNNKKKNSFFILFLFFIACFLFVFIAEADARAGGGFSSGGGFRSSSFSSSSRSGNKSRPITPEEARENFKNHFRMVVKLLPLHFIGLCIFIYRSIGVRNSSIMLKPKNLCILLIIGTLSVIIYPFAVILDIAMIVLSIRAIIKFKKLVRFGYEFEFEAEQKRKRVASALKQIYPDFDLVSFKNRLKEAFIKIQNSWTNQSLDPVSFMLSGGIYNQFKIQIRDMIGSGIVDVMKDLNVHNIEFEKYEVSTYYESIYVYIVAEAVNYLFDNTNNKVIIGDKDKKDSFAEVWCFSRKRNANSINNKGLIDGFCPNCLTKIDETSAGITCESCNSSLFGGVDWVLTGIYQASEWKETHNSYIPGMNNLIKCDSYFNIQNIEDILASMFWSVIEAERTKNIESIEQIATSEFVSKFIKSNYKNDELSTNLRIELESVEIIGIFKENDKHFILGQIIWNHRKSIFVLSRDKNAKTEKCFLGPNFSGIINNDFENDREWLLSDIISFNSSRAKNYIDKAKKYDLEKEYI